MSNRYDDSQSGITFNVGHITINGSAPAQQTYHPEVLPQHQVTSPAYGQIPQTYVHQVPAMPLQTEPFEQMRKQNEEYRIAKQYQKDSIEIQEKHNLNCDYQTMLYSAPIPIRQGSIHNEQFPLLSQSSMYETARWLMSATGLSSLQALIGLAVCICVATWGRIRVCCSL